MCLKYYLTQNELDKNKIKKFMEKYGEQWKKLSEENDNNNNQQFCLKKGNF